VGGDPAARLQSAVLEESILQRHAADVCNVYDDDGSALASESFDTRARRSSSSTNATASSGIRSLTSA
jgi:hypothetical protein